MKKYFINGEVNINNNYIIVSDYIGTTGEIITGKQLLNRIKIFHDKFNAKLSVDGKTKNIIYYGICFAKYKGI